MSTVIGWRSLVSIRIVVFIAGFAGAVSASWYEARIAWAETAPVADVPAATAAVGQTAPAASSPAADRLALSLPEAVRRAMAQAPEVVNAEHAIRQAEARRVGAGVIMPTNP